MPGRLRDDAVCPVCGEPLLGLADLTTAAYVEREYYHERRSKDFRRRRLCRVKFEDWEKAQTERRGLEVHG